MRRLGIRAPHQLGRSPAFLQTWRGVVVEQRRVQRAVAKRLLEFVSTFPPAEDGAVPLRMPVRIALRRNRPRYDLAPLMARARIAPQRAPAEGEEDADPAKRRVSGIHLAEAHRRPPSVANPSPASRPAAISSTLPLGKKGAPGLARHGAHT